MVISQRGRLVARTALRPGSAESAAMQRLVPGDYPQTEQDLAAFPQPVLDLLSRYGTRVAILAEGQTLADTPGLRSLSDDEVQAEALKTNGLVLKGWAQAFPGGPNSLEQLRSGLEAMTRDLRVAGVENYLALALNPFSLDELAEARGIPQDKRQDWKAAFAVLNEGLLEVAHGQVTPHHGMVVLPHTYHNGRAIPESRLRNAREVTASFVEGALGLNRPEEKMVLLHQKFLGPSSELGSYKLAIHEMGHALDHALEQLVSVPGFGALHRSTVDALYEADRARVAAGASPQEVFTSERADDDVREYFAEAVEAYLTPADPKGSESFRPGNSKEGLASKNPALYDYLKTIMTSELPDSAVPEEPKRSLTPPGIPDPDLEVIRLS
jgi:hypothetical protein